MTARWFHDVFGFEERSYEETREQLCMEGTTLLVPKHGRRFQVGPWECLSAQQLHERLTSTKQQQLPGTAGGLNFQHIVADVTDLHKDPANDGAVIQAASQFNALEMVGPNITPDQGITRYAFDNTQGPACALACPAATAFRNYFCVPGGQGGGQHQQLDLLAPIDALLGNGSGRYWRMSNGYALPSDEGAMAALGKHLQADPGLAVAVRDNVMVGIHWSTEVHDRQHKVCQVYCSALPIAYAQRTPREDWKPFATAILDGLYDATLGAAAVFAAQRGTRVKVYLTAVGGGVFGNPATWIVEAIQKALVRYAGEPLDVRLVHYGSMPSGEPWTSLGL